MLTRVTLGRIDPDDTTQVTKIITTFDERVTPEIPSLRRRQLYTYCDLWIHVEDFADQAVGTTGLERDARLTALDDELSAYLHPYEPETAYDPTEVVADRFYLWPDDALPDFEQLHCAVIVNAMEPAAIPEVSRLFAELDATDFPQTMGTLRRQVLLHRGIYLHIQDFERKESKEVIGEAWKESDPRFLKIVEDLTPLVPPYNAAGGQLATRVYHWAATA